MSKIYTLTAAEISDKVCELALTANMYLPEDVAESLRKARAAEKLGRAQSLYDEIIENAKLAAEKYMPICQDCGTAVLFIELGQDLHVEGGDLVEAVNEGVRRAYREGYLRKSVVRDPLADRRNTRQHARDNPLENSPRRRDRHHDNAEGHGQREHEPHIHAQASRRR